MSTVSLELIITNGFSSFQSFIFITVKCFSEEIPDDKWRSLILVLIELFFMSHFNSIKYSFNFIFLGIIEELQIYFFNDLFPLILFIKYMLTVSFLTGISII